ncbi:anti-sigma factor antagonist [Gordonia terrae]|nr:anti-sigma factor antagonist [Gordonia terrae]
MTKLFGFCYLQTPVRTRRTPGRIRDYPSDFMIVTSQTIGSTTGTANGHDFRSRPVGLTVTDSRLPYDLTTHGVSDALGLWVPTELLGEAIAAGSTVAPDLPDSALTDACTALVTQFARDTIIGGADVDVDAEQTVIDIIKLTLDQGTSSEQLVDHPAVIRHAVAELIDRHFRDPAEWARARLLLPENRHLDSIARAAGFTSTATFRSRFRSKYGETPDAYRRANPPSTSGVPPQHPCRRPHRTSYRETHRKAPAKPLPTPRRRTSMSRHSLMGDVERTGRQHYMKADSFEPVVVDDDHDSSPAGRALAVVATQRDQLIILTVHGSIDLLTVPQLGAAVLEAVSERPRGLIIDLTAADFLASSGIAALLAAHEAITPAGRFGVVAEHPAITRPLQLTGFDRTLGLHPTLDDAFAAMHDLRRTLYAPRPHSAPRN